jgi:hypothetical protein
MALAGLDKLLARKKNQKALIAALERDLQDNPIRFFKTVIMPLLPRESKLSFDHEGVIQWKSLLGGSDATKDEGRGSTVEGGDAREIGATERASHIGEETRAECGAPPGAGQTTGGA